MEKAYDLSVLVERLKENGMDLAEDAAKEVVDVLLQFLIDSAKVSPNSIDDLLTPMLGAARPWIMDQLDKIDGDVG